MSSLPVQISGLTIQEKFDMMDALWEDIEAHTPPMSNERSMELDRRVAKYGQDTSAVIPWEQVKADLFKQ